METGRQRASNSAWLQGQSGCNNAIFSSNNYFYSPEYLNKLNSTAGFYQSVLPVITGTFPSIMDTFKNAYTSESMTLPDDHEYNNLAYKASEPIRAIAGSTLATQVVQQLNITITGKSKFQVGIQFGAYASFLSFFEHSQLPSVSENFTGIVDYASSMTFELITNTTVSSTTYPTNDQISVRFLFSNGTAAANPLIAYPLFGQSETATWCQKCGNSTGVCATTATATVSSAGSSTSAPPSVSSGGISRAVAGVIGAMVTLAVIVGIEGLIMLLGGLRLVSKKRLAVTPESVSPVAKA